MHPANLISLDQKCILDEWMRAMLSRPKAEERENVTRLIVCIAVCASILAATPSHAALVTLSAIKDNTLYQNASGSLSNGAGEAFFVGRTNQANNPLRRALLAFDIYSQLPAGVTITSAKLELWCSLTISGGQNIELHTVLKDWGESTSNANGNEGQGAGAANGDATWIHTFRPGSLWTSAGGDFTPAASAVTSVSVSDEVYSWSSPQMVADVQNWLNNPSTDFGWLMRGNEAVAASAKRFNSRESIDPTMRPRLIIEYTPEPGTIGLLLAAAPLIRRRNRR
jgi:hypothetical protein